MIIRKTNTEIITKPFLKWAGGKTQLLNAFKEYYPYELISGKIENYYEPFVGGGAVFFNVVQNFNIKSAFLYDVNEELILTYKVIQKDVFNLIEYLEKITKQYEKLDEEKRSFYYYRIREEFNLQRLKINYNKYSDRWVKRAAQVIFLNKTCFNGLFRFNLKGEFNVPAGRYKNPTILDERNLRSVSEQLAIAQIKCGNFSEVERDLKPNAFVYFDPPYRPISKTASFTSYSKNRFDDANQVELAELFKRLNQRGTKQMLSNSDPKNNNPNDNFFDDLYGNYNIYRIPAKRMINSNANKRNFINEIIVTNYKTK